MNNEVRRLWITLAGTVAFLAVNALLTVFGWSPFAKMFNEQIKARTQVAEAISTERRHKAREAEQVTVDPQQANNHARQPKPTFRGQQKEPVLADAPAPVPAADVQEQVVISVPVAPQRPVAPQMSARPLAPQPPSYILYYPDGSVQYVSPPAYPVIAPVYPGQGY
ncbi:MAG: hypothetical protein R3F02_16905 [Thiolinea sp.]